MNKQEIKLIMRFQFFAIIFFALTVGLLTKAGALETRGVTPTEIRIGVIPDLTGPAAFGSRNHLWSIRNYLHDFNAKGGLYGRKIKLYVEDGKYNPSVALNAFKKLVLKEKVFAMTAVCRQIL